MTSHGECPRCRGHEVTRAHLDREAARVLTDEHHASPLAARVCLSCGHVDLFATDPAALRLGTAAERDVQEYDF